MGENSKIEWTHHTFNIVWGCEKVSPACAHCYAEAWAKRMGFKVWGADADRRVMSDSYWQQPLKWQEAAKRAGERRRVFCSSMADVFERHPTVAEQRKRLWPLIEATPDLDWLLLTKRHDNIAANLPWTKWPWKNVWLGVTAENQLMADTRIPVLLNTPARVRFVSMEPLLGAVDIAYYLDPCRRHEPGQCDLARCLDAPRLSWVIVGGESGPGARIMNPAWPRSLRDQCNAAGVPFHFKQWGEWAPSSAAPGEQAHPLNHKDRVNTTAIATPDGLVRISAVRNYTDAERAQGTEMFHLSKKDNGRHLDGRTWDEFPQAV